jgi:uncharacterized protein (TIGR02996 family)
MNYPAFLAAIRDAPEDDVPRLVCADWLEDEGQSDRAEFIRVQVELSRGVRTRSRSVELLRRLRALIVNNRPRWLGVLAAHAPASVFERGFVEQIELRAATLLKYGEAIFDEHPIHRLALRDAVDWTADVPDCPQLACLTVLDVRENDASVAALGRSPYLGRLRCLDARFVGLNEPGLRWLLRGRLPSLERLNLAGNRFGRAGVEALASTASLQALRDLDLGSTDFTDSAAVALAGAAHLGGLRSLRMSYNPVSEAGVRAVLTSPGLPALARVEAFGTEMDGDVRTRLRDEFRGRLTC